MSTLKALCKRILSVGVVAAAVVAFGQFVVGCAGNQFPLTQTTYFDVSQTTAGEIRYVANATGSADAFVHVGTTMAQFQITNVRGPTVWVEALLVPNTAGDPVAIPIKQQMGAEGLVFNVPDALDFVTAAKPTQDMIALPSGAPPPGRAFATNTVVLWKNSFGQDNFRAGEFDPLCLCYVTNPTLRMAGTEVIPSFATQTLSFNVTYEVEAGGSSGG